MKKTARQGNDISIEVIDRNKINKKCGCGYLREFEKVLSFTNYETLFFVFQENKEKCFWPAEGEDGIVVNFARFPVLERLREAEEEALGIERERQKLFLS